MKRRNVYVLGGVFVALLALVALSRWWISRPTLPAKAPVDFSRAAEKDIDRVVIGSQQTTTTLVKLAGAWRTGTGSQAASASATKVGALLDALGRARFERLVTADADDAAAYGLAAGAGVNVTLYAGETPKLSLRVGGPADVPGTDYVQATGSSAVWVVSGGLKALLEPNPALWRAPAAAPATSTPAPSAPGTAPASP